MCVKGKREDTFLIGCHPEVERSSLKNSSQGGKKIKVLFKRVRNSRMAEDRSHRRGQDLVDLFQRLGSPGADKLHGEDLDWIWDGLSTSGGGGGVDSDERANFLRWLTSGKLGHLTLEKNVLTDEELRLWEELQAGRPDLILSGERLREAIKVSGRDRVF